MQLGERSVPPRRHGRLVRRVRDVAPVRRAHRGQPPHRLRAAERHPPERRARVAVVGVAVHGGQADVGRRDLDAEEVAHQRPQRPGDRPVDHRREQRRQRVGQLLDDARPEVERLRVRHGPFGGRRRLGLGQRGDRPGLHDEELAARPRPLDVLRCAVVLLDAHAQLGELGGGLVVEHRRTTALRRAPGPPRCARPRRRS